MAEGGNDFNLSTEWQLVTLDDMASSAVVQTVYHSPEDVGMCNNSQCRSRIFERGGHRSRIRHPRYTVALRVCPSLGQQSYQEVCC